MSFSRPTRIKMSWSMFEIKAGVTSRSQSEFLLEYIIYSLLEMIQM